MYKGLTVSVVIPCFNEEEGIAHVLRNMPDYVDETIVVDNNSTDGTAEVARALGARLRERPAAEWIARLDAAGVPCGVVRSVLETLAEVGASPLTGIAPSVPGTVRLPPPRLDEHGALVRAAGWDAFAQL